MTRQELSLRKKQQADKFQLQTDLGLSDGKVKLPEGMYQGHGMAALLRDATSNLPTLSEVLTSCPSPIGPWLPTWPRSDPWCWIMAIWRWPCRPPCPFPGALKPGGLEGSCSPTVVLSTTCRWI